jgi:hypothetical protein
MNFDIESFFNKFISLFKYFFNIHIEYYSKFNIFMVSDLINQFNQNPHPPTYPPEKTLPLSTFNFILSTFSSF